MASRRDHSRPDPGRIVTRGDFARELTLLRELAGLSIRDVAKAAGLPYGTAGDYYSGRHLPPLRPAKLPEMLRACGVTDRESVEQWLEALRRVRRSPGRRSAEKTPYRGLASFQPEDAEWFFGREALTRELVDRVLKPRPHEGMLAVVGPSGSGKSSLLRAGLIPALRAVGAAPVLFTPGPDPVGELAARLAGSAGEAVSAIRRDPAYAARLAASNVVIVDQFEELFTAGCPEAERETFLAAIRAIATANSPAVVVIGLRADFYARALRHDELADVLQTAQVVVGPMSESQLRTAIVAPAQKAGLTLEEGLVDLLLQEFGEPAHEVGALPLLSHALLATWERSSRGRLSIADYRESGGIGGAVARTADDAYTGLGPAQQLIARRIFVRLVHVADDTGDTRRRIRREELPPGDDVSDVLDRFIEQRLITATADEFEIVHEALLVAWPRLRRWLDADRGGSRLHRRLTFAAENWRDLDRDPSALLRASRLAEAVEWAEDAGHAADLNALERDFLTASREHERVEQRLARRQRPARVTAVVLALATAGLLTAFAVRESMVADEQRDVADSRRLAVEAAKVRDKDAALAAQLSLAGYQVAHTPEARSSLLESYAGPAVTRVVGSAGVLQSVAFSRDGTKMATGGTDQTVQIWDVSDRGSPVPIGRPLRGHRDTIYAVAFSPDGRLLASGGGDRAVFLWRVADGTGRALGGARHTVYSVAFSPDGRTLAAASADTTVRRWDVRDPTRPAPMGSPLPGPGGFVHSVAYSPDGHTLAAGSAEGRVRLWDLADRGRPRPLGSPLTGPAKTVFSVAFSPDGRTLAAGSADDTVRLWNVADRGHPAPIGRPLTEPKGWVNSVAFSPDGRRLAAASSDGATWVWDPGTREQVASLPHPGPVTAVVFLARGSLATSAADGATRIWELPGPVVQGQGKDVFATTVSANGRVLATTASDGTARLWNLADPRRPAPLGPVIRDVMRGRGASGAGALAPDARTLAVGGVDGGVQLWDVSDPDRPGPMAALAGPAGVVQGVAFSPNGRLLAASGNDKKVWLWSLADRRRPVRLGPLTGPTNYAYAPAFSADGRTLAVGSADFHVYLWDVTNPGHPARLAGHSRYVFSVAFSPDGHTMASAGADNKVLLWDITDRAHPKPLPAMLTGPSNYVWSLAYDSTGHVLAATAGDGTVWLWDMTRPRRPRTLATLTGSPDALYTDVFVPRRPILVTAGVGETIRLWSVDGQQVAARICALAGTPITKAEWNRYLPGRTYHPPCTPR